MIRGGSRVQLLGSIFADWPCFVETSGLGLRVFIPVTDAKGLYRDSARSCLQCTWTPEGYGL